MKIFTTNEITQIVSNNLIIDFSNFSYKLYGKSLKNNQHRLKYIFTNQMICPYSDVEKKKLFLEYLKEAFKDSNIEYFDIVKNTSEYYKYNFLRIIYKKI